MKRLAIVTAALLLSGSLFAQTDSTNNNSDTVKVGNFIIIKKNKDSNSSSDNKSIWKDWDRNFDIRIERRNRTNRNVSTNWWIMDLGFTNFRDQTNYANAQAGGYFRTFRPADGAVNQNSFKLNTGKSTNVNIWFFMQKVNVVKHVVNLKYGLAWRCIISVTIRALVTVKMPRILMCTMIRLVSRRINCMQVTSLFLS